MSVEVVPTIACNIKCQYCYQEPMRLAGNLGKGRIHLDKVIPIIEKALIGATEENPHFTIFGGEPLLLPRITLERLWGFGLEKYKTNGIQSNGELIDDEFIDLFQRYNVQVGISVDGPWPLNSARSNEAGTRRTLENVEKLYSRGIRPSIHIILNRNNASGERLPRLLEWIESIRERTSEIRVHLMENDTAAASEIKLSTSENTAAFLAISKIDESIQPFRDMIRLLKFEEKEKVGCTWNGCDPYTTPAVQGVDGDGTLSNCGRTNKDGVAYRKASQSGSERLLALYHTSYKSGGCKDCRYFFACKGQCPGEGIGGDWRNRSEHCSTYFTTFQALEIRIGGFDDERARKEELEILNRGQVITTHGDSHGDVEHIDIPHQDRSVIVVPVVKK